MAITSAPIEFYPSATDFGLFPLSRLTPKLSQCEPERLVVRRPLFAVFYVYVYSATIAVGVPCNTLAFFVLLRDRVASTTRVFLLAIAAADNLILLIMLLWYSMRHLFELTNWQPLKPLGYAGHHFYALANAAKFTQVSWTRAKNYTHHEERSTTRNVFIL